MSINFSCLEVPHCSCLSTPGEGNNSLIFLTFLHYLSYCALVESKRFTDGLVTFFNKTFSEVLVRAMIDFYKHVDTLIDPKFPVIFKQKCRRVKASQTFQAPRYVR